MSGHARVIVRGDHLHLLRGDDVAGRRWGDVARQLGQLVVDGDEDRLRVDVADLSRVAAALRDWPASSLDWEFAPTVADRFEAAAAARERIKQLSAIDETEMSWPAGRTTPAEAGVQRQLTTEQLRDAGHLVRLGRGGNFSVPGAGKTTTMLAVWAVLRAEQHVDGLLVVAPTSAFEAWTHEPQDVLMAPMKVHLRPPHANIDADIVVVNYEQLERGQTLSTYTEWAGKRRAAVVFDESHRIKAGRAGVRGRAARQLARSASRVFLLSGTPMPNARDDLAAQLDLAWPGYGARFVSGDLRTLLPRTYARTTKDELAIPPLDLRTEVVDLDDDHAELYAAVRTRAARRLEGQAVTMTALQLVASATDPAAALTPVDWQPRGTPAKLRRVEEIVRSNWSQGRKTVVWSSFVATVRRLGGLLEDLKPAIVVGDVAVEDPTADTDRVREIDRFRHDPACAVLVATPHTLGEGVSLHHVCRDQIHVDRTFSAGLFLQSLDRTHRLGMAGDEPARVTVLVARGTIDERVDAALKRKIARMAAALEDRSLRVLAVGDVAADDGEVTDELRAHLYEDAASD